MQLRSSDLDANLALMLKEHAGRIASTADPSARRVQSLCAARGRVAVGRNAFHFVAAAFCVLAGVACIPFLADHGPAVTIGAMVGVEALGVALTVRGIRKSNDAVTEDLEPELLRLAAESTTVNPAERVYCQAAASLAEAGATLGASTAASVLSQLNDLLAQYRELDGGCRAAWQPVEALEQELADFNARLERQSDPAVRSALELSVNLCSSRLADAMAAAPARERAEARRDLVLQALNTIQESLARIAATRTAVRRTDLDALHLSVTQARSQALAVEEAVNEVMVLGR